MSDNVIPIRRLSNGIKVIFSPSQSEIAHLGLTFLAGSRYEQKGEIGLAHFLEHCLFKGTTNRKTFHVLSRIDAVGGELNAFTTKEEICIYASFLRKHLSRAAELISDILLNSNFPQKEIEKEKEVVIDEINSYLDSPSDKIMDDFEKYFFKNHPLGENILGSEESVRSFTSIKLKHYLQRYLLAENVAISVVGNFKEQQLIKTLEKLFSGIPKQKSRNIPTIFQDYEPFQLRLKESNYQSHVVLGGIAPNIYQEDDRRAFNLLINLLGGPALNSRLTLNIREKHGYSYTIEANYTPYRDAGYWNIYFGCNEKVVDKTIKQVEKELKRLREEKLTGNQLHGAKEQYKGYFALGLESNVGKMIELGRNALLFDEIDDISANYKAIDEVTSEKIMEVANKYFADNQISKLIFLPKE